MRTKYVAIQEGLRNRIRAGEFIGRLPGLRELSLRYRVNINTMRRAVAGLARANLIEIRHGSGLHLAETRHYTIGIIGNNYQEAFVKDDYFRELYLSILHEVGRRGDVLSYQERLGRRYAHLFKMYSLLDGFFVFAPRRENVGELETLRAGVPFVVIGSWWRGTRLNWVGTDHLKDSQAGVEHLIRQGHSRIAFIGTAGESPVSRLRLAGYRRALKKHKIACDASRVVMGHALDPAFAPQVRKMFADRRITAMFGADRRPAAGALKLIGERVRDLDLVVYDDFRGMFRAYKDQYHAIRQPLQLMGATAAEVLYGLLNGKRKPPVQIVLRSDLAAVTPEISAHKMAL